MCPAGVSFKTQAIDRIYGPMFSQRKISQILRRSVLYMDHVRALKNIIILMQQTNKSTSTKYIYPININIYQHLTVIYVNALIKNSHNETDKYTNVKIILLLNIICHNSDMLRSILIIFRQLLNTNKAYIDVHGLFNTFIFVHKMSADTTKSVFSSA
jgi:hypothetical protein